MQTYILEEGALNDNEMHIADEGKCFKGGYKVCVEYYTYANAWCNNKHVFFAKSVKNAIKRYEREYGKLDEDLKTMLLFAAE